jgi:threonine dehydratase
VRIGHGTGPDVPGCAEIEVATQRLAGRIRRTPVWRLPPGALEVPGAVTLKLEHLQQTGSFKARGALNSVLTAQGSAIVAASGGNHGAAVAWAASSAGATADVFVPAASPESKRRLIAAYGARLHVVDGVYPDAYAASQRYVSERGGWFVHAYDSAETVAGQATLGVELAEQVPPKEPILVGCGGGGLFAGVTLALAGRNPVIPVEPLTAPTLTAALEAGRPVDVAVGGVAVDSLGAGRIGRIAFRVASLHAARTITVSDAAIEHARDLLWSSCRLLVEPGGAAALAAVLEEPERFATDGAVVVLSGANAAR